MPLQDGQLRGSFSTGHPIRSPSAQLPGGFTLLPTHGHHVLLHSAPQQLLYGFSLPSIGPVSSQPVPVQLLDTKLCVGAVLCDLKGRVHLVRICTATCIYTTTCDSRMQQWQQ